MIVVNRFDLPGDGALLLRLEEALAVFARRPGFVRGRVGRTGDEPAAWLLLTEWQGVGAYRRSLSSYDVKLLAPLLGLARQEPSAFEVLAAEDTAQPAAAQPSDRSSWRDQPRS